MEVQNKHVKNVAPFDLSNLRWSKVVICTDGDVDGFQIRTLILTMLYRLTPTLIREGHVYIAETPLFEINSGDKTWFAYSDKEKNDIVKSLEEEVHKIDRSRAWAGNDGHDVADHEPETRRLIRVMPEIGADGGGVRPAAGGQPPGPEGPYCGERVQVPGDGGYFVRVL